MIDQRTHFESFCIPEPNSGCWLWTGHLGQRGYGSYHDLTNKAWRAHRFAWSFYNDRQIPKGLFVCHTCDQKCCVNPDHLWLGTPSENTVDAFKKGLISRPRETHAQARKTHCPRGHEYTEANTLYNRGGKGRLCRQCQRVNNRNQKAKARAIRAIPDAPGDQQP